MDTTAKTIIWVVVAVVVVAGIWYGTSRQPADEEVIKIGVITPLTGEAAAWGNWVKNSIDLAYQEVNNPNIKLIYEDSMCDPKTGVTAYNKLKNVDDVDLVTGFVCSSVAMAVAPLAEEDDLTMITTGASATDLKDAGEHIFTAWPLNDAQAIFVADYLIENDVKRVAILYVNNDFGVTMKDAFNGQFEQGEREITKIEVVEQKATDIRTQLTKIKETNPEYVFLGTYYENAGFVLRQNEELAYDLNFIGSVDTYNEQTREIAEDTVVGYKYSKPIVSDPTVYQDYVRNYESKYGEKPDSPGEAAYDAFYLIGNALKNKVDVEEYLLSVKDYLGASGKFSIDSKGNIIREFEIIEITE